jgi:cell division protein FtsB
MIPVWSDDHVQALEQTIKTLRAERDEARREVCNLSIHLPRDYALERGWDCFKEEP